MTIPTITPETMTIDQIEVSPLNVRRHRATINAIAAMKNSILGRGQIAPLNVHPLKGSKKFGSFAGGRRTRAFRALIDEGALPADYPIRVEVYRGYTDVELIELSLNENIQRADLELYEICAGIRALATRGQTPDQIAHALGQPLQIVRRWHRVGLLAEPIFAAFAEGQISSDQARAFAATADQALQLSVFEQLKPLPEWQRAPEKIRAALKVGDRQASKLLRLVGLDAYRDAGGRFELDLFADEAEERGRVVDEGKLRELADAKLVEVRDGTRALVGRDIRFLASPPAQDGGGTDYTLQVTPKRGDDGKLLLPAGDVVAWIDLSEAGEPLVTYWWESRKAKFGAGSTSARTAARERVSSHLTPKGADALRDPAFYAAPAKAAVKDEYGISSDALDLIQAMRRDVLRALLVEDAHRGGDRGRDFLVWSQLRVLLAMKTPGEIGSRAPGQGSTSAHISEKARSVIDQQTAHYLWRHAVRDVQQCSWITEPDHAAAFVDFLNAGEADKRMAAAVLAGLALERSANADGFQVAAHDALAQMTRGTPTTIRKLWSPTAEFLAMLPKAQLLAIAEPLIGPETLARWSRVKADELPNLLAQALAGGGNAVATRNRAAAADWLHPLLAFRALDFSEPAPSAERKEMAA